MAKLSAVVKYNDNRVSIHTSEVKSVNKLFENGFYTATMTQKGLNIEEDSLLELHTPYNTKENEKILETVRGFFKEGMQERVNALGFTHKLGILLYGIAGTGKTSLLNFIANKMVEEKDAIVFFCNSGNTLSGAVALAKMIREVQNTPIVFIADEFERYASDNESEMKCMLDGNDSVENSLFLAATNYIDKVPSTLKDRPSRFRVVEEIKGITDKNLMRGILKDISSKVNPTVFTDKEIEEIVKEKTSATLDDLKHHILDKVTDTFVKVERKTIGFKKEEKEDEKKKSSGWYTFTDYWNSSDEEIDTKTPSNI